MMARRLTSIAFLTDPNLVLLLRLSRIYFARCDVLDFLREEIKAFVEKVYTELVHTGSGTAIEKDEIISALHRIGFKFLGGGCQLQRESDIEASDIIAAYRTAQEKNPILKGFSYWNALKKAFKVDILSDTAKLRMSFICMRSLIESGRAFVSGPDSDLAVVTNVCVRLDKNTFRLVMSFLGETSEVKKERRRVLFNDDMTDNFSSELCHGSIAEAVAAGVQEIQSVLDMHTDTTFLHVQAARGHTEDVKALLAMGMDPSIANGGNWENGDGWGELEFLKFTPLHFAAANGRFDAAKVLLEHGADAKLETGWDGGCITPLTKPNSDYWYTGSSTPLHLAARGNHADIIHLILGGPSPAAAQAAALRGVDLHATWAIDVDVTGPSEEFESDDGSKNESLPLTPLAVALMFRSMAAANALLRYGASFDKIGTAGGYARQCILDGLMVRSVGKCRPFVLDRLAVLGQSEDEDIARFMKKYGSIGGAESNGAGGEEEEEEDGEEKKEEDEDAWLDDDWDDMLVAPGDVLVAEDEETGMRIVSDGLKFAAAIAALQLQVHPNLCLSRNAQHVTDSMASAVLKDLLLIFKTQHLSLSPENVEASITAYLKEGQLLQHGLAEASKDSGEALFLEQVAASVQQEGLLPAAADENKAVTMLAKFVEYLLAEVLELSGNATRDKHLQVTWPSHIHTAVRADEELHRAFKDYVFLDVIHQNRTKGDLEWYLDSYEKDTGKGKGKGEFAKADEFEQQSGDLSPSPSPSSSPLSPLQLARMEVDFFTGQVSKGPVMARSYFQEFCTGPALSDEAAVVLQLVAEHHVRGILERARDVADERITNTIKALRPYLAGPQEEPEQEQEQEQEQGGDGEEGDDDDGHDVTNSAAVADLFSCRLDLCYADLKSVKA